MHEATSGAWRRYLGGFFLLSIILALFPWLLLGLPPKPSPLPTGGGSTAPVIVIDPGHGGEDGGASGEDGTAEKDLNLKMASSVAELLSALGYEVRLTREDDRLLYDRYGDLTDYTGHKKTYDLRNRLRFAREADAALLVSIHMNTFPDPECRGLQVYYKKDDALSHAAAERIQSYVKKYVDGDNQRKIKPSTSALYLLHRAEMPAILVECGFLTNAAERSALESDEGRLRLACAIACAIGEVLAYDAS